MECDSAAHLIRAVSRDLGSARDFIAVVGAAYITKEAAK